jgi:hypothetical protein
VGIDDKGVLVKRMVAVTGVLAVAVLVVVLTASGSSTTQTAKSVTLHLVEKSRGFNFIDNPPRQGPNAPPLMGDVLAISSDLQTQGGLHAGRLEATCTITRGGHSPKGPCYGVFALKGGTLAGIAELSEAERTDIAVVGGTGVYEGVTGSIVSVSRGEESPFSDDTVHLVWH